MAKIGKLFLDFEAVTAKWDPRVKRAGKVLRDFGNSAKRTQSSVTKFGGSLKKTLTSFKGLAIVAATVATFRAAQNAFRDLAGELDNLAKTSAKLGALPRDLQVLQVAGELTGVSINKTNMALQRMTRRVAEAAVGTGEAVKALKELGLDAKALNKLELEEKFIALGEAFRKVEDPAHRVRLAMKLFDSEGVDLVNTLALLPEEIDALGKNLDRMGHNLTDTQLDAVETMNDAFLGLSKAAGAQLRQALATTAPALTAFANIMAEVVVVLGNMVSGAGRLADVVLKDVVGFAFFAFHNILVRIMGLFNNLHGVGLFVLGQLNKAMSGVIAALGGAVQGFLDLVQIAINAANKIPKVNIEFQMPDSAELAAAIGEAGEQLIKEGRAKMDLGLEQMLTPEMIKGTELLIDLMTQARTQMLENNEPLLVRSEAEIGEIVDKLGEGVNNAEKFGENLSSALGKGIAGGEKLNSILARVAEQLAGDALTDFFKSIFVGESSATKNTGGLLSKIGNFVFGGPRANGGPVSMGKSYLVGERGPELFTPRGGGTISPSGSFGGMTVNNYFDIRGSDDMIQRQIAASVDMAVSMSVGKMQDLKRRGAIA